MISTKFLHAMKVGAVISEKKMLDQMPDTWSDSEEIAEIAALVKDEPTEDAILMAIKKIKKEDAADHGWDDLARGVIAGLYFGMPTGDNLAMAAKAESIWNADKEGQYGYYQEVCNEVNR